MRLPTAPRATAHEPPPHEPPPRGCPRGASVVLWLVPLRASLTALEPPPHLHPASTLPPPCLHPASTLPPPRPTVPCSSVKLPAVAGWSANSNVARHVQIAVSAASPRTPLAAWGGDSPGCRPSPAARASHPAPSTACEAEAVVLRLCCGARVCRSLSRGIHPGPHATRRWPCCISGRS